ncbi:MAG TPA: c-type cytochrome [Sphingopyxis sp.]|nr:c-type cytochrome [Sphingopyxis sp.]HMP44453.1 c-type cytochrome [Sphingopyxis sp.]HMQ19531.1 c-type cytochrome [Sphingopyxis sp.]
MIIGTMTMLPACHPATIEPGEADSAAVARGRAAAERLGCGACHAMPGIDWPKGTVGPPLAGFGDRALIAGRFRNDAAVLAGFVRDAPALVPGTAMPPVAMTDDEARDIAAWLQSLRE